MLGSAQDGGIPQVGSPSPAAPRTASSIALVWEDRVVLVDASIDLRYQWPPLRPRRLAGILLTHGHVGHYAGLVHLGKEAAAVHDVPVWASPRMLTFLDTNEPWRSLFTARHLVDRVVDAGDEVVLGEGWRAVPRRVPHRAEFTDTFAWSIVGDGLRLLYLPDVDTWSGWDAAGFVGEHDVALVDGTFWSDDEPPGRDRAAVPHPSIVESLEVFAELAGRCRIVFTHLNHTNPVGVPEGPEATTVRDLGFEVAYDGMEFVA